MGAKNLLADNYFEILKNLSMDIKLELISRISDSIRKPKYHEDDSWKKLFGAYQSEQTAEEIIDEIRNSRFTNREIENL